MIWFPNPVWFCYKMFPGLKLILIFYFAVLVLFGASAVKFNRLHINPYCCGLLIDFECFPPTANNHIDIFSWAIAHIPTCIMCSALNIIWLPSPHQSYFVCVRRSTGLLHCVFPWLFSLEDKSPSTGPWFPLQRTASLGFVAQTGECWLVEGATRPSPPQDTCSLLWPDPGVLGLVESYLAHMPPSQGLAYPWANLILPHWSLFAK